METILPGEQQVQLEKAVTLLRTKTEFDQFTDFELRKMVEAYHFALILGIKKTIDSPEKKEFKIPYLGKFKPSIKMLVENYFRKVDELTEAPRDKRSNQRTFTKAVINELHNQDRLIASHLIDRKEVHRNKFRNSINLKRNHG